MTSASSKVGVPGFVGPAAHPTESRQKAAGTWLDAGEPPTAGWRPDTSRARTRPGWPSTRHRAPGEPAASGQAPFSPSCSLDRSATGAAERTRPGAKRSALPILFAAEQGSGQWRPERPTAAIGLDRSSAGLGGLALPFGSLPLPCGRYGAHDRRRRRVGASVRPGSSPRPLSSRTNPAGALLPAYRCRSGFGVGLWRTPEAASPSSPSGRLPDDDRRADRPRGGDRVLQSFVQESRRRTPRLAHCPTAFRRFPGWVGKAAPGPCLRPRFPIGYLRGGRWGKQRRRPPCRHSSACSSPIRVRPAMDASGGLPGQCERSRRSPPVPGDGVQLFRQHVGDRVRGLLGAAPGVAPRSSGGSPIRFAAGSSPPVVPAPPSPGASERIGRMAGRR
ncbi:hypothetical protein HRbin29_00382 [bacterium HR29]|nr:hypothetical protein HRbin29_00382 [bacterium HR29]